MKGIIFSDIDNSLLFTCHKNDKSRLMDLIKFKDSNGTSKCISARIIIKINELRRHGYYFGLASGRSLNSFKKIKGIIPHDFLILEHGGLILDANTYNVNYEWLDQHRITVANNLCLGPLWSFFKELKKTDIKIEGKKRVSSFRIFPKNKCDCIKIINYLQTYAIYENNLKYILNESYIDIIPKTSGKESAIRYILKEKGLEQLPLISIGDAHNDLAMLEISDFILSHAGATKSIHDLFKRKKGYLSHNKGLEASIELIDYLLNSVRSNNIKGN